MTCRKLGSLEGLSHATKVICLLLVHADEKSVNPPKAGASSKSAESGEASNSLNSGPSSTPSEFGASAPGIGNCSTPSGSGAPTNLPNADNLS